MRAGSVLILVHSFGVAIDVRAFEALGLVIVEDAASSFGAALRGVSVGSNGFVSVLSFASTKMMTTGQGGMVLTSDDAVAKRIDARMDYDCSDRALPAGETAFNYGFTEVQASLGIVQLAAMDGFLERRAAIATAYSRAIGNGVASLPVFEDGRTWYRYILQTNSAKQIVARLQAAGIDGRNSVSHFLHDYTGDTGFENADHVRERIVSLPIYPSLSDEEVARIGSEARDAIEQSS
ncbi:MAG: DegT/DnrJ/EryC1/StrS family aminotransferase [Gemmatimonadaceae bacterium]|nr:DegT/DnrJ/EryC1/StrS family aminotransferase [Gemmatimonadaceae bacterium]